MTTTNRAFIKAYRHDTAQPANTVAPLAAAAVAAEHAAATRAAVGASTATSTTANTQTAASTTMRPVERTHSTSEKRPLSSFIPQSTTSQPTILHAPPWPQPVHQASETEPSDFHAGTTVASFQWPAVCRMLIQQSSVQLDHVTRLMFARADAGNSIIGVMGLFPRVGATTTALCLASRAASRGRRVVLGDGNFRRPRLASWLEAVPTAGWDEVLKHTAKLPDAVIHATDDNLDLLALSGRPLKDAQPVVGGLQAAVTAGVLRHAYDLVLLDLGAFFEPTSQPVLLELVSNLGVDAIVAVAGPEHADARDLGTIVEYLDISGCELLGVIENRAVK